MRRTATCRSLWWFKHSSTCTVHVKSNSFLLHTSVTSKEKTQVQPSYQPSTRRAQELSNGSSEQNYDHTKVRRRNCWKLWQLRGLSVEEISCVLHMQHDTIINIILSFERKRGNVNWHRLCKLVMLTTSAAQAILAARSKAKWVTSSSCGATLLSAPYIKNFCPQNVTHSHIFLVHMMLGRKLTSSEILDLASFTDLNLKETYQAEATDSDPAQGTYQGETTAMASISPGETARNTAFPEYDGKMECGSGEESVEFECALVTTQKEYSDDGFLNTSLDDANDRILASKVCQEEKDTAVYRNVEYRNAHTGFHHQMQALKQSKLSSLDAKDQEVEVLTDFPGSVTASTGKNLVTMLDILQWLQNNDMATISNIVNAFGYCEVKHLLFLLLEMLESSIVVEEGGMFRIASEQSVSRLQEPTKSSQALSNPLIERRMHRALCLKAVVLNVVIHEPKTNVEFIIRHVKADNDSTVYHVQICEHPSCTCPDFVMRSNAGLDYMPCKHLFYVYLVQLHLEKNLEHLMFQRTLKEEDLERILQGHY